MSEHFSQVGVTLGRGTNQSLCELTGGDWVKQGTLSRGGLLRKVGLSEAEAPSWAGSPLQVGGKAQASV